MFAGFDRRFSWLAFLDFAAGVGRVRLRRVMSLMSCTTPLCPLTNSSYSLMLLETVDGGCVGG